MYNNVGAKTRTSFASFSWLGCWQNQEQISKTNKNTGTINQHPILSANIFSSRSLILIIIDRWDKDSIIRPLIVISLSAISLVSFHFSLLSSCNNQKPRFRQFRQVNFLFLRIKFCECLGGWTALSSHILQSGSHLSSTALKVTSDEISRTQTHYCYTDYWTLPIGFPISGNHSGEQAGTDQIYRTGLIFNSSSDSHQISPSDTMTHLITWIRFVPINSIEWQIPVRFSP